MIEFMPERVTIVTLPNCVGCERVKNLFREVGVIEHCNIIKLNEIDEDEYDDVVEQLVAITNTKKCPMVFFGEEFIGDEKKIENMDTHNTLRTRLSSVLKIDLKENDLDF